MRDNILIDKSVAFAVRIVNLYKHLTNDEKEYVMSKQVLRSGTSIGANIHEANYASSKADFINKWSDLYVGEKQREKNTRVAYCITGYFSNYCYFFIFISLPSFFAKVNFLPKKEDASSSLPFTNEGAPFLSHLSIKRTKMRIFY